MRPPSEQTLEMLLKSFKLPTFAREYAAVGDTAAREGLTHPAYLLALARMEAHERAQWESLAAGVKTGSNDGLKGCGP